MKLILNLFLLFVAFLFVRRAIGRLFSSGPKSPPPRTERRDPPRAERPSGGHPAIADDEIIEDGEFEELD